MASRNRRGRDDDEGVDEPIEDEALDDLDDSDVDDFDDDLEDEDDDAKSGRSRAATATRTRAVNRTRTDAAPGILGRLVRRFRETVAELQKVIWPTRKELLTYTTVVVIFVALVMSIVAGLDFGYAKLMLAVFGKNE